MTLVFVKIDTGYQAALLSYRGENASIAQHHQRFSVLPIWLK